MRRSSARIALVVLVAMLAAACQPGSPQAQRSPPPHGTAAPKSTPDPQRCDRLAKRGFTPCPPTADQLKLPPTTIKNATDGAIDDSTVERWGQAFRLSQAYYYWAMQEN